MIARTEKGIRDFCKKDVFGTRTIGYLDTYGMDVPEADFYVQTADGQITAVLSSVYSEGSLTCSENADFEELSHFIMFLGLRSLLCDRKICKRLSLPEDSFGYVMLFQSSDRMPKHTFLTPDYPDFKYREVYELLKQCAFSLGDYNTWLGDFALRVRKNTAKVLAFRENGKTLSTASVLFESEDAVYLGAVATDPSCRGRGLGGDVVLSLANCGKRAEILCKEHRVTFYESLGFSRNGEFSICNFLNSTNR